MWKTQPEAIKSFWEHKKPFTTQLAISIFNTYGKHIFALVIGVKVINQELLKSNQILSSYELTSRVNPTNWAGFYSSSQLPSKGYRMISKTLRAKKHFFFSNVVFTWALEIEVASYDQIFTWKWIQTFPWTSAGNKKKYVFTPQSFHQVSHYIL